MISVCLASFNGESFIQQQIESILCQLSKNDELVISDDGSTDSTIEIINSFKDKRIVLLNHKKPEWIEKIKVGKSFYYATSNFENALKHAKGDFIFLSDQDDIWLPGKVNRLIELLETYDCVTTNYQKIDYEGNLIQSKAFAKNPQHQTVLMNIFDSHFRGCCMAFTRNILEKILPFPKKIIGHDYWIGAIATKYGKIYYEDEPFIKSRWYDSSVSAKKKTSLWFKISFRLYLLIKVLFR